CSRTLGASRGRDASHQGAGGAPDASRGAPAPPARAGLAGHAGPGPECGQRLCGPRGGTQLYPGARAMSTGGRHTTARPGPLGAAFLLFYPWGVTDGAGAWGAAPWPDPARPSPARAPGGTHRDGGRVVDTRAPARGPRASAAGVAPCGGAAARRPGLALWARS